MEIARLGTISAGINQEFSIHPAAGKEDVCSGRFCSGAMATSLRRTSLNGGRADYVVVAAERLTSKGAYVACSRGRRSCIVYTPDKARLIDRLPEGNRRAALDVLSEIYSEAI